MMLMETFNITNEQLDKIMSNRPDAEDEKAKVENIFEETGIGKPRGTHEGKTATVPCEMINTGRIKNPIDKTLEYYDIVNFEINTL